MHLNDLANTGTVLVGALREAGVEATLIDPERHGRNLRYPGKLVALPLRVRALVAAAVAARRLRPDLVHVHYARQGWMAAVAGRPYLIHCHGTDVRGVAPTSAWGRAIAPWMAGARRVLFATPDLATWVRAFRPDGLFIPNPIVIHPQLPPDGPMVDLFVGVRFDPVKGSGQVVETIDRLLQLRPHTSLTLVDQGIERERAIRAISRRATTMTTMDFAPHGSMPGIFARHRMAMGQMAVGALGNYELEAMAAGLPTAASFRYPEAYDAPPPLIEADTPNRTAARLAAMLDDEAARRELGLAARSWVAQHHGTAAIARDMYAIYAKVITELRG